MENVKKMEVYLREDFNGNENDLIDFIDWVYNVRMEGYEPFEDLRLLEDSPEVIIKQFVKRFYMNLSEKAIIELYSEYESFIFWNRNKK
jgi:hypothetical protein